MAALPGRSVSLIYVCFFDFICNGVKLGIANKIENRAYHLSKDWGGIDPENTLYFKFTSYKHSNEIRKLERYLLTTLKSRGLKIQPCYPDGREAYGDGQTEFFRYEGIPLVLEFFYKWQSEGKGIIIRGFEPSKNLPPLKIEPALFSQKKQKRPLLPTLFVTTF